MHQSEKETVVLVAETRRKQRSGDAPVLGKTGLETVGAVPRANAHPHRTTPPSKAAASLSKSAFRTKAILWVAGALIAPIVLGVLAATLVTAL